MTMNLADHDRCSLPRAWQVSEYGVHCAMEQTLASAREADRLSPSFVPRRGHRKGATGRDAFGRSR
jgi:hypothetical protein